MTRVTLEPGVTTNLLATSYPDTGRANNCVSSSTSAPKVDAKALVFDATNGGQGPVSEHIPAPATMPTSSSAHANNKDVLLSAPGSPWQWRPQSHQHLPGVAPAKEHTLSHGTVCKRKPSIPSSGERAESYSPKLCPTRVDKMPARTPEIGTPSRL